MSHLLDSLKIQLLRLDITSKRAGVYIISYPKSGRTWLRVLIGKAICLKYNLPETLMLDTYRLAAVAGLPRTYFTHDFSEILSELPYDRLPARKAEYARSKVIFIARDVKDVLVSSYFQATKRTYKFNGSIAEFIRSDKFGAKKVVTFYNIWHANQSTPRAFLLLRYEDMHRNPASALVEALRVMGVEHIDDAIVRRAVEFARFDHMKEMEAGGYFNDARMRPGDARDAESYKVRKGVVGGYMAYLSEEDVRYIDKTIAEMGCPFIRPSLLQASR